MDNEFLINCSNNNEILNDILKKLENFINNANDKNSIDLNISQIKDIIEKLSEVIKDNNKNYDKINKYIKNLTKDINNQFKDLKQKNSKHISSETTSQTFEDGLYIGEIKNKLRDGKGVLHGNDGNKYEGEWKNDKKEGKGTIITIDGEKYEGDWKNNKKEGRGAATE